MVTTDWEAAEISAVQQTPDWYSDSDTAAYAEVLQSTDAVPNPDAELPEFFSEVTFETDSVVYIASVGPDANCHRLAVDDVSLTEETLTIEGHVECEAGMAAQSITYPATIVWVPETKIQTASVSIIDGWQQSHTVETTRTD